MHRRSAYYFLYVVVILVSILNIPRDAFAQPKYFHSYKAEFEDAEAGSPEQLNLALKMVDVVFHYDLERAIELSQRNQDLARQSGNTDALAAAYMDEAVWVAYMYDSTKADDLLKKAEELLDEENGDPIFLSHYYSARFGYSLVNEAEEYNPRLYLQKIYDAAHRTDDPHLQMGYYYMAATSLVFVGKVPATDPTILELRGELARITTENKYETGKLNLLFLDAKAAQVEGNFLKCLLKMNKAQQYAKEKQYPLFEVRALLAVAHVELDMILEPFVERNGPVSALSEDKRKELVTVLGPVRKKFAQCVELAEKVKMSSYLFESRIYSAFAEFYCGNEDRGLELINLADGMEYGCFRSWVLRDKMYRFALDFYARQSDSKNIIKFAKKLASQEHVNNLSEAEEKAMRFRLQLTELKRTVVTETSKSEKEKNELVQQTQILDSKAQQYQGIALVLAGCLAFFVMGGALIWNRSRLHAIESELSDEKQMSEANREIREVLQDRVNRLQRMESLGMLAGGVAHDFNNLLVGVICNAEVLETRASQLDDFGRQRVQQIIGSAEQAADLSRQMLAYAGKTQILRKNIDINSLTNQMSRILAATAGSDIELTIETDPKNLSAEVDETQMEQVLLNLVSNARSACGDAGRIIVRTGRETIADVRSDMELQGTREEGGRFVYLEVEDNGKGIDKNSLQHIFEPFYSVSENGRGLGLAVVYGIVNGHDGLIRLRSREGEGTTFRILLPQTNVDDHSAPVPKFISASPIKPDAEISKPGSILVADDEPTIVEFAETLLTMKGWDVVTVSSGRRALEILKDNERKFDCVLLDVRMPDMGADEVLAKLKEVEFSTPIVLMSGYSKNQLNGYLKNEQVKTIISKPFRSSDLMKVINNATMRRSNTAVS